MKANIKSESILKLVQLVKEHPNYRIVAAVDSRIVEDEGYSTWLANIGDCCVERIFYDKERGFGNRPRYYFSDDERDIKARLLYIIVTELSGEAPKEITDEQLDELVYDKMTDEQLHKEINKRYSELPWEDVIALRIEYKEYWR